jgi:hypothetical protein
MTSNSSETPLRPPSRNLYALKSRASPMHKGQRRQSQTHRSVPTGPPSFAVVSEPNDPCHHLLPRVVLGKPKE